MAINLTSCGQLKWQFQLHSSEHNLFFFRDSIPFIDMHNFQFIILLYIYTFVSLSLARFRSQPDKTTKNALVEIIFAHLWRAPSSAVIVAMWNFPTFRFNALKWLSIWNWKKKDDERTWQRKLETEPFAQRHFACVVIDLNKCLQTDSLSLSLSK